MGSHPLNLVLRFLLEMVALVTFGVWGWRFTGNWYQYVLAVCIPLVMAIIWGVFNVPGDPSRSGEAPVVVPGIARLVLEIGFFSIATWMLHDINHIMQARIFAAVVTLHYLISFDRILWLLSR